MSIEEGLESTDVVKINAAREEAKDQVSKYIQSLQSNLVVKDGKYLFDEINENLVQELHQKLDKSHDNFLDLHYRYLFYRYGEEDPYYFDEKEQPYSDDVRDQFSETVGLYVKYKKALAVSIEVKKKIIENENIGPG